MDLDQLLTQSYDHRTAFRLAAVRELAELKGSLFAWDRVMAMRYDDHQAVRDAANEALAEWFGAVA